MAPAIEKPRTGTGGPDVTSSLQVRRRVMTMSTIGNNRTHDDHYVAGSVVLTTISL
jgi:hypothetical protein